MVEIISGVYGGANGLKRPGDKPFSLSPVEEARLVRRGVARYVEQPRDAPAPGPEPEVEMDTDPVGFDDTPPEDDELPEDVELVDLSELTAKELREVGKEYGLTFKGNASKADMIQAITEAQAAEAAESADEDEPGPDFDPSEAVM